MANTKVKTKTPTEIKVDPSEIKVDPSLGSALLRLRKVRKYINHEIVDRQTETNSMLLALLTKTSCLLLGPRGTSKTGHFNLFAEMVGLSTFDVLISPTTKPDQIFGPTDVPALAKGTQQIKTEGYAPTAELLFLDEVFKAQGSVLNQLLWLLNERKFRNGDKGIQICPLQFFVGASNEIPTDSSLAPIVDRFLLRHAIGYLPTSAHVKKMLGYNVKPYPRPEPMTRGQIALLQKAVDLVEFAENHIDTLLDIRRSVEQATGVSISDRRIRQSVRIIKAQALLSGRTEVEQADLEVLSHLFWDDPAMAKKTQQLVMHKVDGVSAEVGAYEDAAIAVFNDAMKTGEVDKALDKVKELYGKVSVLESAFGKQVAKKIRSIIQDITRILDGRKLFEVLLAKDVELGEHYKVSEQTAVLWSKEQLRSAGFKQRRKTGHWWQPVISEKMLTKRVQACLNVVPKIITLV